MEIHNYQTHCLNLLDMLDSVFEGESVECQWYEQLKPHLIHSMREWANLAQAGSAIVHDGFSFFIRGSTLGLSEHHYMVLMADEVRIDLALVSAAHLRMRGVEAYVVDYLEQGGDSVFVWEDDGLSDQYLQLLTDYDQHSAPQDDDGLWLAEGFVVT